MSEVLTHTKRRDFQNCQRYFYHRHEQLLTLRHPKPGRRRGAAFSDAVFAIEQAPGSDWAKLAEDAIEAHYATLQPGSAEEAQDLEVEKLKLVLLAPAYCDRYGFALRHERRERQFDLPLINPATHRQSRRFRRGGKIDALFKVSTGRAVIVEDKLVGTIQKAMIERLPLDAQISEYADALLDHGLESEVHYRHTLLPGTNPKLVGTKAKGNRRRESLAEFGERLQADIEARPDHYFDEQRLLFTTEHLEDYRVGRWVIGQQIMWQRRQARSQMERWPMNPSRCWEYGGCEFIPLCTKRPDAIDLYERTLDNPELRRTDDGATSEYPDTATG